MRISLSVVLLLISCSEDPLAPTTDAGVDNPADSGVGRDASPLPHLDQPEGLTATDGQFLHRIEITWNAVPDAAQYHLEVATSSPSTSWTVLTSTTMRSFAHEGLDSAQTFFYRVSASADGYLDSPPSAVEEGSTSDAPVVFDTYFKPMNIDAWDLFGVEVALSADGRTMAVGALFESSNEAGINPSGTDNSMDSSGAVYVYTREAAGWRQQAYVKSTNPGDNDHFGAAVDLSDDGNTMLIGARREDSDATGVDGDQLNDAAEAAGAAYVFVRSGGTWTQEAYLKASNTEADDWFGNAVAISGDGSTLAVPAWVECSDSTGVDSDQSNNDAPNSGAVYIFTKNGGTWAQEAYLKAFNTDEDDRFGYDVSLSTDGNTLAVGAWGEESSATGVGGNEGINGELQAGAAYVFTRVSGAWSQAAYLKASNTDAEDGFGYSVAISAAGDRLAVGSFNEDSCGNDETDNNCSDAGAAYVYSFDGSAWGFEAYIKASNPGVNDYFGWGLDLSQDGNLLAVGAWGEDGSARGAGGVQNDDSYNSGAVYLYTRDAQGGWTERVYLKSPNTGGKDRFGNTMAFSSDNKTLVVGAPEEASGSSEVNGDQTDNSKESAGAAYTFELDL